MSEENVEIVRQLIAAFNGGGDAKLAEQVMDPEATFEPLLAGIEGATYRGAEGVMRWVSEMNETFAEVRAEDSSIEDLGDVVLVTGKTTGLGRAGGVPIEQRWFTVARFRERRITYCAICRTRGEALEAAGLSE
jgi:ketosteroid isomerase-like protein